MAHECKCGGKCRKSKALETAVDQYHKWDDMVFKGKDGVPPLVNVKLTAYTMDFFLRETQLLKLLFASNPSHPEDTNTNMATVLYDGSKLKGIAIEHGDDEKAYIAMEQLDAEMFKNLPDWREQPELHASIMRARIQAYTGRDIGLIKCADLNGFFGNLGKVVENENTLEMLLEGVKFACSAVAKRNLSIQPEPRFFEHLKFLYLFTELIDAKELAGKISGVLPDFGIGLLLRGGRNRYAGIGVCAEFGRLHLYDYGDLSVLAGTPLKDAASLLKNEPGIGSGIDCMVGLSTEFLYNAVRAALTHSPYKLGKAVFNAVRKGEIVVC